MTTSREARQDLAAVELDLRDEVARGGDREQDELRAAGGDVALEPRDDLLRGADRGALLERLLRDRRAREELARRLARSTRVAADVREQQDASLAGLDRP